MDSVRTRYFSKLKYGDPRGFLRKLSGVEVDVSLSDTPRPIKNLRSNKLKSSRERRDAALFCVGMSELINREVYFAPTEDQDFDFVSTWFEDDTQIYCPVQLKEVVPGHLNKRASVQETIDRLTRYADSRDVTVALKLNRIVRFDPTKLVVPGGLSIGGLWVFGSVVPNQSKWSLWGDFLTPKIDVLSFDYPR
ncbi:MAG: hypothetical protein AAFY56_22970 [Pseudomonadota bacterium]